MAKLWNFSNGHINLHIMDMQMSKSYWHWPHLNQRPWKPRGRHNNHLFICSSKGVMAKLWNVNNGHLNLHIIDMQISKSFQLWHNLNQRPLKPRDRHKNNLFIFSNKGVMAKLWNFSNGRLNLHIMQNAQGCQVGITRNRNQHPSKIQNPQKNFVGTLKPR